MGRLDPYPRPQTQASWAVTFTRQNEPERRRNFFSLYGKDFVVFHVMGFDAQTAIDRAEEKFEALCGSEARPNWHLERIEAS